MTSEAWASAFVAAQAEMPNIEKTKTATIQTKGGGSFSYKYADLPEIIAAVRPVLKKHGLAVAQSVENIDGRVGVRTVIYHKDGHVEDFGPIALPSSDDARQVGSAVTYARRYSLCAALGIAADEDTDAKDVGGSGAAGETTGAADSSATGKGAVPSPAPSTTPIEGLAAELGWSGSKVLAFARKELGLKITKADWNLLTATQTNELEAALAQQIAEAS